VGILLAWVFAIVGTIVILKIVDAATGIRVTEDQEIEGLDITQHGEEAYNLES
jgi:Amt family ammonium transporter